MSNGFLAGMYDDFFGRFDDTTRCPVCFIVILSCAMNSPAPLRTRSILGSVGKLPSSRGRARRPRARRRPAYGARPLKRVIQKLIENPIARDLLAGEIADGDVIRGDVDATESILVFRTVRSVADVAVESEVES